LKSVQAWHPDIQKHKVRAQRLDGLHGLESIGRLANDGDVGFGTEPDAHPFACERFIIRDHN
jgi:hypothetical protein